MMVSVIVPRLVRSVMRAPSPRAVAAMAAMRSASGSGRSCATARPSIEAIITPNSSGIASCIDAMIAASCSDLVGRCGPAVIVVLPNGSSCASGDPGGSRRRLGAVIVRSTDDGRAGPVGPATRMRVLLGESAVTVAIARGSCTDDHALALPGCAYIYQPAAWGDLSAEAQDGHATSTLALYRTALRVRRTNPALGDGTLEWIDAGPGCRSADGEGPGTVCGRTGDLRVVHRGVERVPLRDRAVVEPLPHHAISVACDPDRDPAAAQHAALVALRDHDHCGFACGELVDGAEQVVGVHAGPS